MASAKDLREVVSAARPLIEEWLDIAEQIAALRDMATERGLDWSQIKALVKAQVQDERAGDNKRVHRIIEKAEFASAYADMLGLSEKMNENNFSAEPAPATPPHDPETGEVEEVEEVIVSTDMGERLAAGAIEARFGAGVVSRPAMVLEQVTEEAALTGLAASEPYTPPAFLAAPRKPRRPNCLNPDACASYSSNHCHTCTKAAEAREAA